MRDSVIMKFMPSALTLSMLVLAACQPYSLPPASAPQQLAPAATPQVPGGPYQITPQEAAEIPVRVLQQVNLLRANLGQSPVTLSPQLTSAALVHARDMSAQNRAWHWGTDGSSPLDRARAQGYFGRLLGENISESYETDIETLTAWMSTRETRDVIMDPAARELGIAWYQEPTGKIWWVMLVGA